MEDVIYNNIFIGVGSNINPEINISKSLTFLKQILRVSQISTFYKTKPVGGSFSDTSPDFYNGMFQVSSRLKPEYLKVELRLIEEELGRVRVTDKFAPRTIDLDIVVFEDIFIESIDLTLPDPDIFEREFLAVPLLELAPNLELPPDAATLESLVRSKGWGANRAKEPGDQSMVELKDFTDKLRKSLK